MLPVRLFSSRCRKWELHSATACSCSDLFCSTLARTWRHFFLINEHVLSCVAVNLKIELNSLAQWCCRRRFFLLWFPCWLNPCPSFCTPNVQPPKSTKYNKSWECKQGWYWRNGSDLVRGQRVVRCDWKFRPHIREGSQHFTKNYFPLHSAHGCGVVSVVDEIVAFAPTVVIFEAPVAFTIDGLLKKKLCWFILCRFSPSFVEKSLSCRLITHK